MKTLPEMIAVMQAADGGAKIRSRIYEYDSDIWRITDNPVWDWAHYDYEVVPEPLVIWVNEYPGKDFSLAYLSQAAADQGKSEGRIRCIRFVEDMES